MRVGRCGGLVFTLHPKVLVNSHRCRRTESIEVEGSYFALEK